METKTQQVILVEATKENIQKALENIKAYAKQKGYQIKGDFKLPTNLIGITKSPDFDSKKQEKALRRYLTRLDRKVDMCTSNKFLHFLFRKIYKIEGEVPRVEYSEKETKIKEAKKAWKKVAAEAEVLRLAYKTEKGDYYKKA